MNDFDCTPLPLDPPMAPEMNVYFFFKSIANDVDELQHEILEHLVAAGTKRDWFPELPAVVSRFTEHEPQARVDAAIARLRRQRLLELDPVDPTRIRNIVGGITHETTRFRAMTDEHVPFHLQSALDAMTIAPTLQKATTITTACGVSGSEITLRFDREGNIEEASPPSVTAFIPGWDGVAPISESVGPRSHFFLSDAELNQWQTEEGDPDGMPLTQDTIRLVGTEMAAALAALYVTMSVR